MTQYFGHVLCSVDIFHFRNHEQKENNEMEIYVWHFGTSVLISNFLCSAVVGPLGSSKLFMFYGRRHVNSKTIFIYIGNIQPLGN